MYRKIIPLFCVLLALGLVIFGTVVGVGASSYGPQTSGKERRADDIQVAPHVIALSSDVKWLHVHTTLPFSTVDTKSVELELNYLKETAQFYPEPGDVFEDDCGNLVARFNMLSIKSAIRNMRADNSDDPDLDYATFILTADLLAESAEQFMDSEEVRIR